MSDIRKLIEQEREASEADPDTPLPKGARVTRPNQRRSTVFSIRLNADEVAALQSLADMAGLPASTLARAWIVERLREEQEDAGDAEAELRAARRHLAHLQKYLRNEAS